MTDTDERLTRIEDRLAHIESLLERFSKTVQPYLENPSKLVAKLLGGR